MQVVKGRTLSVFDYSDYRVFLKEFHRAKKSARSGWSYSVWAKQLKLKSPSSLVMIVKGQRNPSDSLVQVLTRQLELGLKEAEYFSDLVQLHKNQHDPRLSILLMERLARRHRADQFRQVDLDAFAAISNWYYYAIRELVGMPGFQESPLWISRRLRFRVSPPEARKALVTLVKIGLLKRDRSGKLQAADLHVETSSVMGGEAMRRFHEQALENAKTSLRTVEVEGREIIGTSFVMPRKKMAHAKEQLRKFLNEFCDRLEDPSGDGVFHLELALYPLTRPESAP